MRLIIHPLLFVLICCACSSGKSSTEAEEQLLITGKVGQSQVQVFQGLNRDKQCELHVVAGMGVEAWVTVGTLGACSPSNTAPVVLRPFSGPMTWEGVGADHGLFAILTDLPASPEIATVEVVRAGIPIAVIYDLPQTRSFTTSFITSCPTVGTLKPMNFDAWFESVLSGANRCTRIDALGSLLTPPVVQRHRSSLVRGWRHFQPFIQRALTRPDLWTTVLCGLAKQPPIEEELWEALAAQAGPKERAAFAETAKAPSEDCTLSPSVQAYFAGRFELMDFVPRLESVLARRPLADTDPDVAMAANALAALSPSKAREGILRALPATPRSSYFAIGIPPNFKRVPERNAAGRWAWLADSLFGTLVSLDTPEVRADLQQMVRNSRLPLPMRQYAAVALFDLGDAAGRRAVDQLLKGDLAAEFWRDRGSAPGD